jgi:hypothetical protein
MCFRSKAGKASRPWTGGSPGRRAAASRCSWSWQAASCDAGLDCGLCQGSTESTNTKIRLLTRIAFGFPAPEALIALAMLASGATAPACRAEPDTHGSVSRAEVLCLKTSFASVLAFPESPELDLATK